MCIRDRYKAENYTSYIAGTAAPTAYSDPRRANNYTPGTAYSVTVAWDVIEAFLIFYREMKLFS